MSSTYYVYILCNDRKTVLYTGITNNLSMRVWEHKYHTNQGFTNKYNVQRLVYYQQYADISNAIKREKQLKRWHRDWKVALIEQDNPEWLDLYEYLIN
ncbi:MAG: GIY-YIG nuclease family protein [Candidatus Buchananbacteria bacterium]|nr:GIY-YIG nuclease family protein [Candidatus Buchananbacteria bacterium]